MHPNPLENRMTELFKIAVTAFEATAVLVLIVGILVGTYSSIFVASPILMTWQERQRKKNG